jgi:hypothetical protein
MAVALKAILADIDGQFRRRNTIGKIVRIGYQRWVAAALEPVGRMKRIFGEEATAAPAGFAARGLEALAERAKETEEKKFALALMREARDISPSQGEQARIEKEIAARKSSSVERWLLRRVAVIAVIGLVGRFVVLPLVDAPPKGSIIVTENVNTPHPGTRPVPESLPRHLRDSLGMLVGSVVLGPLFDSLAARRVDVVERLRRIDTLGLTLARSSERVRALADSMGGLAARDENMNRELMQAVLLFKRALRAFESGYGDCERALANYNVVISHVRERGLSRVFDVEAMPEEMVRRLREFQRREVLADEAVRPLPSA